MNWKCAGNDADAELEKIDREVRHVPEVLEVRLEIYQGLEKWELMRVVAKNLAGYDPDNAQWWISWAAARPGAPIRWKQRCQS